MWIMPYDCSRMWVGEQERDRIILSDRISLPNNQHHSTATPGNSVYSLENLNTRKLDTAMMELRIKEMKLFYIVTIDEVAEQSEDQSMRNPLSIGGERSSIRHL